MSSNLSSNLSPPQQQTRPSNLKKRSSPRNQMPMADQEEARTETSRNNGYGINDGRNDANNDGRGEDEPLLGRAGDASQQQGGSMLNNVLIGTAVIAQAGIWIFTAVIWGSVLSTDVVLFSAHPLLNSAGILTLTQAILLLQPTHTPSQKKTGTYYHSALNSLSLLLLLAALAVIEYNKGLDPGAHWHSVHSYLGIVTYSLLVAQAFVGATAFYTPSLYGGVANAKALYKYHRGSGYVILVMLFVTVNAATFTDFNAKLQIKLWAVVVAAVITLIGVVPRVKKQKLGL